MYPWFQLSARPFPAHCIWRPEVQGHLLPLKQVCPTYRISSPSSQAPRVIPAESQGRNSGSLFKTSLFSPVPIQRALLNMSSPCKLLTRTFHPHHFLLIFKSEKKSMCYHYQLPRAGSMSSYSCFLSFSYNPDSLVGASHKPVTFSATTTKIW